MAQRQRMYALFATAVLVAGIVFALGAGPAYAADNNGCFACHGDQSVAPSQTIAGKTVSLWVNPAAYATSKHGGQLCTACHGTQSEAHDKANRTYGGWARLSSSASDDTSATWNFRKVDGNKCVTCHTDPEYAKFFDSDHSTSWNMAHNPDGSARHTVEIVGSLGTSYTANENYVNRDCGRCHMGNSCNPCHWKATIIQNPKAPTIIGSLLDLWTDYSASATTKKGGLSEYAIDWTANIATHDFNSVTDLTTSNEVCNACHTGYTQTPEALFPDLGIFDWGPRRHGQTSELMLSGARGVHESLQLCTDCHKKIHDLKAPESMLQWRQDHDVNCIDCHPEREIKGVGLPHQGVYCTACHGTEVNAILDPDGGGTGVPLVIPRVTKHLEQQGYPTHNLRRDVDCVRCHVEGGNQTGALPMSQITAVSVHGQFTISYTAGTGGTISGVANQTVNLLESGTAVTAVANVGYHFVSWSDGVMTASRTEFDVLNNVTATATFASDALPKTSVEVAGSNRYATAIAASEKAFPTGSTYVIVATGMNWPDALGGSALAGALDAPILLTRQDVLPAEVRAEIVHLGATKAIILGGTPAVSAAVAGQIDAIAGVSVERIAGDNRYDTANKVAARAILEMGPAYDGTAFVATGLNFPDALAASPLAAAAGWPIYLANPNQGNNAGLVSVMQAAGVTDAILLGDANIVADSIKLALGTTYETRLAGANRYDTAVTVAAYGVANAGLAYDKLAIATGTNFPDALAGGVLQGKSGSVMLLTPTTSLNASVASVLATNKASIFEVRFLGSTSAVSQAVRTSVMNILN